MTVLIFAHSTRQDTIITPFDRQVNCQRGESPDWPRVQSLLMCTYTCGALYHVVTVVGGGAVLLASPSPWLSRFCAISCVLTTTQGGQTWLFSPPADPPSTLACLSF